ncbi:hypothetical protein FNF27_07410 [Cafeteria roenbergensis]|uniref:Uncharacterized protein n=1 Tax=Cafeteria roenbergensis TaxID=33653 RepID=A0A5A8DP59_CAFRO|nr:hypothetical protein FNF27_07410 [Cafeteria roenbergensis]
MSRANAAGRPSDDVQSVVSEFPMRWQESRFQSEAHSATLQRLFEHPGFPGLGAIQGPGVLGDAMGPQREQQEARPRAQDSASIQPPSHLTAAANRSGMFGGGQPAFTPSVGGASLALQSAARRHSDRWRRMPGHRSASQVSLLSRSSVIGDDEDEVAELPSGAAAGHRGAPAGDHVSGFGSVPGVASAAPSDLGGGGPGGAGPLAGSGLHSRGGGQDGNSGLDFLSAPLGRSRALSLASATSGSEMHSALADPAAIEPSALLCRGVSRESRPADDSDSESASSLAVAAAGRRGGKAAPQNVAAKLQGGAPMGPGGTTGGLDAIAETSAAAGDDDDALDVAAAKARVEEVLSGGGNDSDNGRAAPPADPFDAGDDVVAGAEPEPGRHELDASVHASESQASLEPSSLLLPEQSAAAYRSMASGRIPATSPWSSSHSAGVPGPARPASEIQSSRLARLGVPLAKR